MTFPKMKKENWNKFKEMMPEVSDLHNTYSDYLCFINNASEDNNRVLQPFIPIEIDYEKFISNKTVSGTSHSFTDLCLYANEIFNHEVKDLMKSAIDKTKSNLILPVYIFLLVEEIGQDKGNDICSIYLVRQSLEKQNSKAILENEKMFFEYGLALAASYAIKYDISFIKQIIH